jgi:flagellin-like protein
MSLKKIEKFFIFATILFLLFIFSLAGYYYYLVSIGEIAR